MKSAYSSLFDIIQKKRMYLDTSMNIFDEAKVMLLY